MQKWREGLYDKNREQIRSFHIPEEAFKCLYSYVLKLEKKKPKSRH